MVVYICAGLCDRDPGMHVQSSCQLRSFQIWCRFQFEHTPDIVAKQCNCSICNMKGIINVHVAPDRFELLSGADSITEYQVRPNAAAHIAKQACNVTLACGIWTCLLWQTLPLILTSCARTRSQSSCQRNAMRRGPELS